MGLGDKIRGAIQDATGITAIGKALTGNGHTTSGMDAAMQAHADKLHPVSPPDFPAKPKFNPNPPE